ncbi:hypothetical protein BDW22DRAFT_1335567 [Trametopsis cervina]|nr:hypothetical protein BDW22DRAFT_1335567 [Trametopsis cervina]
MLSVIGGTGVGKSSVRYPFVVDTSHELTTYTVGQCSQRLPASSELKLRSCTIAVAESTSTLSNRVVLLLGTLGFDDTTRSDIDILQTI